MNRLRNLKVETLLYLTGLAWMFGLVLGHLFDSWLMRRIGDIGFMLFGGLMCGLLLMMLIIFPKPPIGPK